MIIYEYNLHRVVYTDDFWRTCLNASKDSVPNDARFWLVSDWAKFAPIVAGWWLGIAGLEASKLFGVSFWVSFAICVSDVKADNPKSGIKGDPFTIGVPFCEFLLPPVWAVLKLGAFGDVDNDPIWISEA